MSPLLVGLDTTSACGLTLCLGDVYFPCSGSHLAALQDVCLLLLARGQLGPLSAALYVKACTELVQGVGEHFVMADLRGAALVVKVFIPLCMFWRLFAKCPLMCCLYVFRLSNALILVSLGISVGQHLHISVHPWFLVWKHLNGFGGQYCFSTDVHAGQNSKWLPHSKHGLDRSCSADYRFIGLSHLQRGVV